ncbi:MAG TPA: hypothetical protein VKE40_04935 [Gemmataceae bacterium]|nr:hypothetical protein [Gemmataceae bacterium]
MGCRLVSTVWYLWALTGAALSAPGPKDPPAIPDYYPTTVGTRLVYDLDNGDSELALRIVAVEEKGAEKVVTVEQRGATRWLAFEQISISEKGLREVEHFGQVSEPWYLLKFPIKAGDKWDVEWSQKPGIDGKKGTVTVIDEEEVTVPAGKFKAVKVERVYTEENGKALDKPFKVSVWFAKGIGRVKVVPTEGSKLALKSFVPGGR